MPGEVENPASMNDASLGAYSEALRGMIREGWDVINAQAGRKSGPPDYSGILPLSSPLLEPFFGQPGVFLIFGPAPDFSILSIGAAQGPMERTIWSRLETTSLDLFAWRWEATSDPPPTYAACLAFSHAWSCIPLMRDFLAEEVLRAPPEKGLSRKPRQVR